MNFPSIDHQSCYYYYVPHFTSCVPAKVSLCTYRNKQKHHYNVTSVYSLNVSFEHVGHRILKVLWTYLHFRPLHRVVGVFPFVP